MEVKLVMKLKKILLLIWVLAISLVACSLIAPSGDSNNTSPVNNEEVDNEGSNLNLQENEELKNSNESNIKEPDETEKMDLTLLFPDDATNISIEEDNVSYMTSISIEALIDFYKTEMDSYGYNLELEVVVADTVVLRFVKGSVAIKVVTSSDGEGGFFVILADDE